MNITSLTVAAAATLALSGAVLAQQSPQSLVLPSPPPSATPASAPKAPVALKAASPLSVGLPPLAPSTAAPVNAPQKFVDPRRVDGTLPSSGTPQPDSSPKGVIGAPLSPQVSASAPAARSARVPVAGLAPEASSLPSDKPVVTVSRKADGTRVIRSQVPASFAEAEAQVAAQLPVPSVQPSRSGSPVGGSPHGASLISPSAASLVPGLNDGKALPKWASQSMERSAGKSQLAISQGVTEIIKIARNFPNRFITPFEVAEVITTDEALTHDGVGGAVVVATASDKPIGIFIQDRNSDRAISLVLIPEDIPQREIRLVLDDTWSVPVLRNQSDASQSRALPSAQTDYVEHIKSVMRALALGEVPEGHALSNLQPEIAPACQMPGLTLRLGQMLEGSTTRIAVYVANNPNPSPVPVQEAGCYRRGVLAVSAFPRPLLEAGQSTEVYVVMRKETPAETASSAKRRPSLVGN